MYFSASGSPAVTELRTLTSPGGRLFVPPAYFQTASDSAVQLNSADDWLAMQFCPLTDYALSSVSRYVTAVVTEGNGTLELYSDVANAPGASLAVLGTLGCGAAADAWTRLTVATPYQMERGKLYWLVEKGAAATDWSLSVRRVHTGNLSMFPSETLQTKSSTNGGGAWAAVTQDSLPAMWSVIINSQANHATQLGYGQFTGTDIYIPGSGNMDIPVAGLFLDCSALTADTLYYTYAYDNAGSLALEASATVPTVSSGLEVKTGATSRRLIGMVYPKAVQAGYQGPVCVPDGMLVTNFQNRIPQPLGKSCPYTSSTLDYPATTWERWRDSNEYRLEVLIWSTDVLYVIAKTGAYVASAGASYVSVGLDGVTPHPLASIGGVSYTTQQQAIDGNLVCRCSTGYHYVQPLQRSDGGGRIDLWASNGYRGTISGTVRA